MSSVPTSGRVSVIATALTAVNAMGGRVQMVWVRVAERENGWVVHQGRAN